jgi:hypothetical protein
VIEGWHTGRWSHKPTFFSFGKESGLKINISLRSVSFVWNILIYIYFCNIIEFPPLLLSLLHSKRHEWCKISCAYSRLEVCAYCECHVGRNVCWNRGAYWWRVSIGAVSWSMCSWHGHMYVPLLCGTTPHITQHGDSASRALRPSAWLHWRRACGTQSNVIVSRRSEFLWYNFQLVQLLLEVNFLYIYNETVQICTCELSLICPHVMTQKHH